MSYRTPILFEPKSMGSTMVRANAMSIALATEVLYWSETQEASELQSKILTDSYLHLSSELGYRPVKIESDAPITYFIADEDGTFRETNRGNSRVELVDGIATGQYEPSSVYRQQGSLFDDISHEIAREVLALIAKRGEGSGFIPNIVRDHLPDATEALENSWTSPAQLRSERANAAADNRHQFSRENALEAAE